MDEDKFNLFLIETIRKHECLYNPKHVDYMKKNKIDKAWSLVGYKVKRPASWCRAKWKNLRTVFSRHLREEIMGNSNKKKRKYYLSNAMEFIIPFTKFSRQQENYTLDAVACEKMEYLDCAETAYNDSYEGFVNTKKENDNFVKEIETEETSTYIVQGDGFQSFFNGLLPEIAQLNAKRRRILKVKIVELINDLSEEQEAEEKFIAYESGDSLASLHISHMK